MLGLFDSGLGGLTVLRRVRELLPAHDLIYFADQAHVPYGERTDAELIRLLAGNLARLREEGALAVVMACNTSCAVADRYGWPDAGLPVLDLIESAASMVARTGVRRVAVIATPATVRSGAYQRAIRRAMPEATTVEIAAPMLVPLVERGVLDGPEAEAAVAAACAGVPPDVHAVLYGCTHYPLLDAVFARILGTDVLRLDPAIEHARRVAALVHERAIAPGRGSSRFITTGDPATFARSIRTLNPDGSLPEVPAVAVAVSDGAAERSS
jgi:glutamate racemase